MTKAFIADGMKNAVSRKKNAKPFPHSNYQVPLFPKLWVRSPTQASGELDKGAIFNPRIFIALLNIFRVSYNYFELRTYSSPFQEVSGDRPDVPKVMPRALRIPGTDERIELEPTARRTPERKTPAMRHGIEAFVRRKTGKVDVPDLHRVIYRPWLYAGTKVGAKLNSNWRGGKQREQQASIASLARTDPKPVEDNGCAQAETMDRVE